MKKILLTLATIAVAISANAQVYLGGTVGLASTGSESGKDETAFKLLPEIGYNINNDWAVGTVVGYSKGSFALLGDLDAGLLGTKAFTIAPYARWTFVHSKMVNVFLDMGFGFMSGEMSGHDFTAFNVGVQPGVAVNLNNHFSFISKVGFFGYQEVNPEGDGNNSHAFGFDVNGNNIQFGLIYNF